MKLRVEMKSGRIVIVDKEKLRWIYSDGDFSTRGVRVYVTQQKKLIAEPWSKWQGEDPMPFEIDVKDFCKYPHWERVEKALASAEIEIETEEI